MSSWFLVSDAGHWTMIALAALSFAALARLVDLRLSRRSDPDAVGCLPWTGLFMLAIMVAGIAGLLAMRAWLSP